MILNNLCSAKMSRFVTILLLITLVRVSCEICQDDICEYTFSVHHARTMTYYADGKAHIVRLNGSDLEIAETNYNTENVGTMVPSDDVITADGIHRDVLAINGQFPGPSIEVMKGAQIVVHVTNNLFAESVTLHWHGIHQYRTPFMDGTAHITQCPISPGQTFTYRFKADPAGTHWYHPHIGYQRIDGAAGMLIIHEENPTVPYFNVGLTDWFRESMPTFGQLNPYGTGGMRRGSGGADLFCPSSNRHHSIDGVELTSIKYQSALINGRGRSSGMEMLPLETFNVTAGETYRFRVACMAAEFSFEMSVEGHTLTLVALDGQEVQPITNLTSIIIGPGERTDFEITADQSDSRYWFKADVLYEYQGDERRPPGAEEEGVKAILAYTTGGDPVDRAPVCDVSEPCAVYGCLWPQYPDGSGKRCIGLESAKSVKPIEDELKSTKTDQEIFLNFEYVIGSSINGRKFQAPEEVLLGAESVDIQTVCQDSECESGCACTNILDLPLGQTVQLVISNLNPASMSNSHHYIHIHGYQMYITKVGYSPQNTSTGLRTRQTDHIRCDNDLCTSQQWETEPGDLNLVNPPLRDTFVVPAGGYVVARLKTYNPGYWLLHCHQVTHHNEGMSMVLNVGGGQHPSIPQGFPTCAKFEFDSEQYQKYQSGEWGDDDGNKDEDGKEESEDDSNGGTLSKAQIIGLCIGVLVIGIILGIIPTAMCLVWGRHKSASFEQN